ncbi:MAG: hypothetical protein M3066_04100 [Actinomycetota bacterium]|nr:hypothetical protein [Actinomycetota bacterium]
MTQRITGQSVGGGPQDVYLAAARFQAVGGGSSRTAKVLLAGAVGLLLVGVAVLLAALATRRRTVPQSLGTTSARGRPGEGQLKGSGANMR